MNVPRKIGLAIGLLVLLMGLAIIRIRPVPAQGNFPPKFSETDKREILSAARHDAMRQIFSSLMHADFRHAWRWAVNSRKQTVRSVGNQQDGQIWVTFGIDEPGASEGYAIWARYFMTNQQGHWVITQLF